MFKMTMVICHIMVGCHTVTDIPDDRRYQTKAECTERALQIFRVYSATLAAQGIPINGDLVVVRIDCSPEKGA